MSVNAVATLLGQTSDYVRTLIYSGKLPAELDARTRNYVVDRGVAEAYLAGRVPRKTYQAAPSSPTTGLITPKSSV